MSWLREETGPGDASGAAARAAGCWLPRRRPCAPAAPSRSAAAVWAAAAKTAPATKLSLTAAPRKGRGLSVPPLQQPSAAAGPRPAEKGEGYLVLQLAGRLQVLPRKHAGCHIHIWGHLQERGLWGDSREAWEQILEIFHHLSAADTEVRAWIPEAGDPSTPALGFHDFLAKLPGKGPRSHCTDSPNCCSEGTKAGGGSAKLTEDQPRQRCVFAWRGNGPELQETALLLHRCPSSWCHPSIRERPQEEECRSLRKRKERPQEEALEGKARTSTIWLSGLMSCTCGTLRLTGVPEGSACKADPTPKG